MNLSTLAFASASLLAVALPASAAPGVRIEHAAARLVVIPEARGDVAVTVSGGDPRLPRLQVRREGEMIVVEGGLDHRIASCGVINWNVSVLWNERTRARHPGQRVFIRGVGPLTLDHLPTVTARVPMRAQVDAGDAVWGDVGPSDELTVQKSGCGDWTIGAVRGRLTLTNGGSGDTRAQDVDALTADLFGSGDLYLGRVAHEAQIVIAGSADAHIVSIGGGLHTRITGSGDLASDEANGPIDAAIRGSGDVKIHRGRSPQVSVKIAGSGDFAFGGEAGALSAAVSGSGDVTVAHVTGPVSKSVAGSGEVHVGR